MKHLIRAAAIAVAVAATLTGLVPATTASAARAVDCAAAPASAVVSVDAMANWFIGERFWQRQDALTAAAVCLGQPLTAAQQAEVAQLTAEREASFARIALATEARDTLPRLTVVGGTARERAQVRRMLAGVTLPHGTLLKLVGTKAGRASGDFTPRTGSVTVAYSGEVFTVTRPGTIRIERGVLRRSVGWQRYVLLHEAAHAAAHATGQEYRSIRSEEIAADCLVGSRVGARFAHRWGHYLRMSGHRCTKAELAAGRLVWAAVK